MIRHSADKALPRGAVAANVVLRLQTFCFSQPETSERFGQTEKNSLGMALEGLSLLLAAGASL
jgi:hypothetical protein